MILIVEDNERNRKLLRSVLCAHGYEIAEAETAEDALRLFRQQAPDLVLMDISLRGQADGFDALEGIRAEPCGADVPVLAVTAAATPEDRRAILDAGFDAYISKPISIHPLLEQIRRLQLPGPAERTGSETSEASEAVDAGERIDG